MTVKHLRSRGVGGRAAGDCRRVRPQQRRQEVGQDRRGRKEVPTTVRKSSGDPIKDAEQIVADGYKGTVTQPPATGPKAVKGKTLFVISCYQLLDSCKIPSDSAQAAGKALGWQTTLVDGGLDAGKQSDGIKQAISSHADAIILAGIDCAPVQASMQQAKQAGIKLVGLYSFDCDDKSIANAGAPLFDYIQRVGALGSADSAISYGEIKAAYAIAKLKGKVVAINTTSPNHTVLQYVVQGLQAADGQVQDVPHRDDGVVHGRGRAQRQAEGHARHDAAELSARRT